MKNYVEMFEETYEDFFDIIRENKKKEIRKKKIFVFLSITLIISVGILLFFLFHAEDSTIFLQNIKKSFQEPLFWLVIISLGIVVAYLPFNETPNQSIFEEKAKAFAASVYLNDVIAALAKSFSISPDLKEKLKSEIYNTAWYDNAEKKFCGGMGLKNKPILIKEHEEYILIGWEETEKGFSFCLKQNKITTEEIIEI